LFAACSGFVWEELEDFEEMDLTPDQALALVPASSQTPDQAQPGAGGQEAGGPDCGKGPGRDPAGPSAFLWLGAECELPLPVAAAAAAAAETQDDGAVGALAASGQLAAALAFPVSRGRQSVQQSAAGRWRVERDGAESGGFWDAFNGGEDSDEAA